MPVAHRTYVYHTHTTTAAVCVSVSGVFGVKNGNDIVRELDVCLGGQMTQTHACVDKKTFPRRTVVSGLGCGGVVHSRSM